MSSLKKMSDIEKALVKKRNIHAEIMRINEKQRQPTPRKPFSTMEEFRKVLLNIMVAMMRKEELEMELRSLKEEFPDLFTY